MAKKSEHSLYIKYHAIKVKTDTFERLHKLREFIISFGIDGIISVDTKDYDMKKLSMDNLIKLLMDISGVV